MKKTNYTMIHENSQAENSFEGGHGNTSYL